MVAADRTGILGGTFDPIHCGHRDVAMAARRALSLARVLLVPARCPPHRARGPVASPEARLAMVRLVAADEEGLEACDDELRSEAPSYTARTLDRLQAAAAATTQFFFITGSDAFAEIETWYDYPRLLDRYHFVVVSRPGQPVGALRARLPALGPRMREPSPDGDAPVTPAIWLLDAPTRDVSSSGIREAVAAGRSVDDLVHPAVASYITRHGLYADASPGETLA